eukprot:230150-Chlamydomonas_euryale.AAC.1
MAPPGRRRPVADRALRLLVMRGVRGAGRGARGAGVRKCGSLASFSRVYGTRPLAGGRIPLLPGTLLHFFSQHL